MTRAADAKERFAATLRSALADRTFVKLTLGAPRDRESGVKNLLARPLELRAGPRLQLVWRFRTRDVTKTLAIEEGVRAIESALATEFGTANLFTTRLSANLEMREDRPARYREEAPRHATPPDLAHDRKKKRAFGARPRAWLTRLGLAHEDGTPHKGAEGKVRQIARFVELFAQHCAEVVRSAAEAGETLEVVDLASGKAYLTFAVAEWLRERGSKAHTLGIEARSELVALCTEVARSCGFPELGFVAGTIESAAPQRIDVLLALHACDTATDEAIARGITAGARAILVSPCCHREVRPGWQPASSLEALVRHGILEERLAELVTDGLRAALLEASGFETKVVEFVGSEHTARNLLLIATRSAGLESPELEARKARAAERARSLATLTGVRGQHLAGLLGFAWAPPPAD